MPMTNAETTKRYRERNPDKFRESLYKYWKQPYECECGITVTKQTKNKHLKTNKHKHMMEFQEMKKKIVKYETDIKE